MALLAGCRRPAGELLTINLPELAGAELQTAWTLDGAVNPETYYEMAPDRPLGYVRMTGYHDGLLLVSIRDSVHLVGGDGRGPFLGDGHERRARQLVANLDGHRPLPR